MSEDFEHLPDIPEIQEFIENMNLEVSPNTTSKVVQTNTNTLNTTGLVLEVTIAIKLSSDDNCQTIMLNKVLIDTGCTKTIIKRNSLPDQFFESKKQSNEVSWTTNAGSLSPNMTSRCNSHCLNSLQVAKSAGMSLSMTQHSSPNMK